MITVTDKYKPLYNTDKPIILITGGRGGAKSFQASLFLKRLTYKRGHKILFTRYTLTSAYLSIIPEFSEKIKIEGDAKFFETTKAEIINKYSKSEILFRGIKTSSGNQTANLKSIQGLTTFVVDEAEEWHNEDDYDTVRLSIRTKGVKNRVIIIMNPSTSSHFIYQKYIKDSHRIEVIDGVPIQISTHPNVCHIHTTYLDNLEHLSESFLADVSDIKQNNSSKYQHKIIGRWADRAEGTIFDYKTGAFDDGLPYCYGQDYGFTVDPTTLVKVAIDKTAKRLYVKELFFNKSRLGTADIIKLNKAHLDKETDLIIGDSAEGRLIQDIAKGGLNIRPAKKGAGSVTAGISKMQGYEIIVDPNSFNLIDEFNNYTWNDKKAGIPIDDFNHGIDATRYACEFLTQGGIGRGAAPKPKSIR